jgi:hypothetical protein
VHEFTLKAFDGIDEAQFALTIEISGETSGDSGFSGVVITEFQEELIVE